jgi:hypothetical protein
VRRFTQAAIKISSLSAFSTKMFISVAVGNSDTGVQFACHVANTPPTKPIAVFAQAASEDAAINILPVTKSRAISLRGEIVRPTHLVQGLSQHNIGPATKSNVAIIGVAGDGVIS